MNTLTWKKTEQNNHFVCLQNETVYRKEINPVFWGGYKIFKVHKSSKIANEWLKGVLK